MRERQKLRRRQIRERYSRAIDEKKIVILRLKKLTKDSETVTGGLTGTVEEVRGHLECPICLEFMGPPKRIWQCPQSHLICETCRDQLEDHTCPCCRTDPISQRSRVAENMARAILRDQ